MGASESDGDGLTTALLAGQRVHGRRDGRLGLAGKPDTCVRAVSMLTNPALEMEAGKGQGLKRWERCDPQWAEWVDMAF